MCRGKTAKLRNGGLVMNRFEEIHGGEEEEEDALFPHRTPKLSSLLFSSVYLEITVRLKLQQTGFIPI